MSYTVLIVDKINKVQLHRLKYRKNFVVISVMLHIEMKNK